LSPRGHEPSAMSEPDAEFKIFMAGESGSGKTTLLHGFIDERDPFPKPDVAPTERLETHRATVDVVVNDIRTVSLTIVDAGGSVVKNYGEVMEGYYAGSKGGIIAYDAHDPKAFDMVKDVWVKEVRRYLKSPNVVIFLVAMKQKGKIPKVNAASARAWANGVQMQFSEVEDARDARHLLRSMAEDMCTYHECPLEELSLREQLAALLSEIEQLRKALADLQKKYNDACSELDGLKARMQEMEAAAAAKAAELAALKAKMEAEAAARAAELEAARLAALHAGMAGKEKAMAKLKNAFLRMMNLELATAISNWRDKVVQYFSKHANMEDGINKLRRVMGRWAMGDLSSAVRNWIENAIKAKSDAARAAAGGTTRELKGQISELKSELGAAKREVAQLTRDLQAAKDALDAATAEAAALRDQISSMRNKYEGQIADMQSRIDDLLAQLAAMKAHQADADSQWAKANQILHSLFEEVRAAFIKSRGIATADQATIGLPRVYQQHRLGPLCDFKVDKITQIWEILYSKMYTSFRLAMPGFDSVLEEKNDADKAK